MLNRFITATLIVVMLLAQALPGDEPVQVQVLPAATLLLVQPAAADDVVELKANDAPGEQLNLEVLAAPLQALFGIGAGGIGLEMPAAADMVAQNDAMAMQFQQQFRPFLMEELNFVRLVCSDLPKQQRMKIKSAGEAGLKQAAKTMAELQGRQNQVRILRNPAAEVPEPRSLIRQAITKALQESLTEEQMARYKREAADRAAHRKQAAILSVVSRLDGCLFLNEDQRTKIVNEISSHWQDKWEQWLMLSSYGPEYFPQMPDELITAHLDGDQKSVYQGLQKLDFGFWWGGMQNEQNDGWWGDEPANAEGGLNGVIFMRAIGF